MVTASPTDGPVEAELRSAHPVDLRLSFADLRRGRLDPTVAVEGRTLWRATRTPAGPATEAVVVDPGGGRVRAWAWGDGAGWLLDGLAALVGAGDRVGEFEALVAGPPGPRPPPGWAAVAGLARRRRGLRIPRTAAVFEACVPTVLEQKVTGIEARRSWRRLVAATSEAAPGPRRGLMLPPAPAALAALPSWVAHRLGFERKRAGTIARVASAAARLEEAAGMAWPDARRRLMTVPGVGEWSAAEVALVALGEPDAVSIGDFHLPNQVAWTMLGQPRGDDALMLELLEPWRGHRGRVLRLLDAGGVTAPKFGPRQPLRSWRDW